MPARSHRTRAAAGTLCLLLLPTVGCEFVPEDWVTDLPSFEISAADGGRLEVAGITLDIPPGALSTDELITVEIRGAADYPELDGLVGPVIELKPDGLSFATPVTLSLPVPEGVDLDDLTFIAQIEAGSEEWRPLYGTTVADGVVTAEISHFTGNTIQTTASQSTSQSDPRLTACLPESCGGTADDLIGTWTFVKGCAAQRPEAWEGCAESMFWDQTLGSGTVEITATTFDMEVDADTVFTYEVPASCVTGTCAEFNAGPPACQDATSGSGCSCEVFRGDYGDTPALPWRIEGTDVVVGDAQLGWTWPFCVSTVGGERRLTMGDTGSVLFFTQPLPSVTVKVKVLLHGPLDTASGTMKDGMRTSGVLPTADPYTALGYAHLGDTAGSTTTADVLAVNDPLNSIVDWVYLELRDAADPATVVATRSALLQRDGDVVDMDGTSPVRFVGSSAGSYYVAVLHVNHLPVMTAATVDIDTDTVVDFTTIATYGTHAQRSDPLTGNRAAMWAGDADRNGRMYITGSGNDAFPLYRKVITHPTNLTFSQAFVVNEYAAEDVNRDGKIALTGAISDAYPLNVNVIMHPDNTTFSQNFVVEEQLP